MRKIIQTTFLFLFLCTFSSCFDVTEEIIMKNDGSGQLKIKIDLSQSKANLANYMNAGEINGVEIPTKSDIKKDLQKLKKTLSKTKGISKVKIKSDFEEFIFELNGNFTDAKALNKAINAAVKTFNQTPFPMRRFKHFEISQNKFTRLFQYTKERFTQEEYDGFSSVVRYLMESANVVSIYRFEKPIKTVSNKKANLSPSKKAVMLKGNIAEFVTGEKSLKNDISF